MQSANTEYTILRIYKYKDIQFDKVEGISNKVISKRIYVTLDYLVLSRIFIENGNQKHHK